MASRYDYDARYRATARAREIRAKHVAARQPSLNRHNAAYLKVQRALKKGTLVREPCLFCDAPTVVAHHHDYDKPLEVTWLCRGHHGVVHRKV